MSIVASRTNEMARDNATAISTFRALSNMVLNLPRSIGIKGRDDATEALTMLKARLPGTDVEASTDDEPWGPGRDAMPSREKIGIGRPQEMSGGGTTRFTEGFSPDAHSGDRNDTQGVMLAALLERQDRLEDGFEKSRKVLDKINQFLSASVEKSKKSDARLDQNERNTKAIATLLAQSFGLSKADAAKMFGASDEDEDEDEDRDTTEKAVPQQFDVRGLMNHLSSASRGTGMVGSLAQPPSMGMAKAFRSEADRLLDDAEIASAQGHEEEAVRLQTLAMRIKVASTGQPVNEYFLRNHGTNDHHKNQYVGPVSERTQQGAEKFLNWLK